MRENGYTYLKFMAMKLFPFWKEKEYHFFDIISLPDSS